jgi:hypothetical protein
MGAGQRYLLQAFHLRHQLGNVLRARFADLIAQRDQLLVVPGPRLDGPAAPSAPRPSAVGRGSDRACSARLRSTRASNCSSSEGMSASTARERTASVAAMVERR